MALAAPFAVAATVASAQTEQQPRPQPAAVKDAIWNIVSGQHDPLFTAEFAARAKANAARLGNDVTAVIGGPSMARPLGGDSYMVYYGRGFALWHLDFTADGRISGASYEIRDNPGTRGISLSTSDQSGLISMWNSVGEVAAAYQEQRRQEELFNDQVLARIHASGGYTSSGSGVGARGSIISDEQLGSYENAAAGDTGRGESGDNVRGSSQFADNDGSIGSASSEGASVLGFDGSGSGSAGGASSQGSGELASTASNAGSGGGSITGAIIVSNGDPAERARLAADEARRQQEGAAFGAQQDAQRAERARLIEEGRQEQEAYRERWESDPCLRSLTDCPVPTRPSQGSKVSSQ